MKEQQNDPLRVETAVY